VVEARARFGFASAVGSTDDSRMRRITQHLPPETARVLLEARAAGAGDCGLARLLAGGLGEAYFRNGAAVPTA
jgi:hypothetical protein